MTLPRMNPSVRLRLALPSDPPRLSEIALAAKAHWGYEPAQIEAWRDDLGVHSEAVLAGLVCVAEFSGRLIGWIELSSKNAPWAIEGLWVTPEQMRRGVGKALLTWARSQAAQAGQAELLIDADPHAEAFYLAQGARRIGLVPAPIPGQPERMRPQLLLPTGKDPLDSISP